MSRDHRAVILPDFWDSNLGRDDYFRPLDEEVAMASRLVARHLASDDAVHRASKRDAEALLRIRRDLAHYYVQYFGVVRDGRRKVVCNFFYVQEPCPVPGGRCAPASYWRTRPVYFKGGGSDRWHASIDIESEKIDWVVVNADK